MMEMLNKNKTNKEHMKEEKKSRVCLSPTSAIKKWKFDRFVLAHFFLIFMVSFVIGILFMHSTFTLWDVAEEVNLDKVLMDLGVEKLASFVKMDTISDDSLTRAKYPNDSILS